MTRSSSIARGTARRQRILDLAKQLSDDIEAVSIEEIDGEFYWRIVHDDLFQPLNEYAASIAPHLVGAPRSERFDAVQQREIAEFRESALASPRVDAETQQFALDVFKEQLKERELKAAAQDIIAQLPLFVWTHFRNRQRIPLREPLEIRIVDGGKTLEMRIYSQIVSGTYLEDFLNEHHRGRLNFRSDPDPKIAEEVRANVVSEVDRAPTSRVNVQVTFELVRELAPSPATSAHLEVVPFVQVILPRPLPPPGYLGRMFDNFLSDQQEQVHQLFPAKATNQEKKTAIRTWAVGLLVGSGEATDEARWDVEARISGQSTKRPTSGAWFEKSRTNLLQRVPEAEDHLFRRKRRTKSHMTP
jgi:hypothetical protein